MYVSENATYYFLESFVINLTLADDVKTNLWVGELRNPISDERKFGAYCHLQFGGRFGKNATDYITILVEILIN